MLSPLIASVVGAIIGGLVGWLGNYHLQQRMYRRFRSAEELKDRLYILLGIVSRYWIAGGATEYDRESLEAELIAAQHVVIAEFTVLRRVNKGIERSWQDVEDIQLDLLDAATGGSFQQTAWNPDPQRVMRTARIVTRIVRMLT